MMDEEYRIQNEQDERQASKGETIRRIKETLDMDFEGACDMAADAMRQAIDHTIRKMMMNQLIPDEEKAALQEWGTLLAKVSDEEMEWMKTTKINNDLIMGVCRTSEDARLRLKGLNAAMICSDLRDLAQDISEEMDIAKDLFRTEQVPLMRMAVKASEARIAIGGFIEAIQDAYLDGCRKKGVKVDDEGGEE